ncbi:hypothetical protein GT044_28485 [Streptomyces sp. SID335]|uniref:hypothetical protein n=1 Tax=unclassified Streptomyces TaxID=2593676 RepID=UPI001372261C|nr:MULTISPECIES: hypothetical protein [unclassified Streptomyces]MYY85146.1 hypothetical protein [Streptomyces sp. SID335]NEA03926.1 hypothetical protein [Streptomyces sp. SID10116]
MGSSRRRAAGPALRYEHVPGARTSGRSGERKKKGERERRSFRERLRSLRFGLFVCACVIAGGTALALGPIRWAGELWHDHAPGWPGEGYGFAATAGLLLPAAGALMVMALLRTNWRKEKLRSSFWTALALPNAFAALMLLSVLMETVRPKNSRRRGTCSAAGEYCWISSQYPYVWVVALVATVLGVVAVAGAYDLRGRMRKRRLTPPGTAAPWGRPRRGRPTCRRGSRR